MNKYCCRCNQTTNQIENADSYLCPKCGAVSYKPVKLDIPKLGLYKKVEPRFK